MAPAPQAVPAQRGRPLLHLRRLPGLRGVDRNFDRLPESLRWVVERLIHDPAGGEAPKPALPEGLREYLIGRLCEDVARLEGFAGRRFGWLT